MLFPEPTEFFYTAGYRSPLGPLELVASEHGLLAVSFPGRPSALHRTANVRWVEAPERLRAVVQQLAEYFAGTRRQFDLPLDLRGSGFHRRCWQALGRIPYGEVWSYAELAGAVGSPLAARAVGQANRSNPIAIIVPCHRVIASDGTLGGYAAGLAAKRYLLRLEGVRLPSEEAEQGNLFGGRSAWSEPA
jgi:methylated-DNA-[protein]-cysteine S-methyltransferase